VADPIDRAIEAADPLTRLRSFLADESASLTLSRFEGIWTATIRTQGKTPDVICEVDSSSLTEAVETALDEAPAATARLVERYCARMDMARAERNGDRRAYVEAECRLEATE
jgi:hypothetical protein